MRATEAAAPVAATIPPAPPRKYLTVNETARAYPFSPAALRDLVFKAASRLNSRGETIRGNGLAEAGAVIRVGRKVLIDVAAFEAWLDGHKGQ